MIRTDRTDIHIHYLFDLNFWREKLGLVWENLSLLSLEFKFMNWLQPSRAASQQRRTYKHVGFSFFRPQNRF